MSRAHNLHQDWMLNCEMEMKAAGAQVLRLQDASLQKIERDNSWDMKWKRMWKISYTSR